MTFEKIKSNLYDSDFNISQSYNLLQNVSELFDEELNNTFRDSSVIDINIGMSDLLTKYSKNELDGLCTVICFIVYFNSMLNIQEQLKKFDDESLKYINSLPLITDLYSLLMFTLVLLKIVFIKNSEIEVSYYLIREYNIASGYAILSEQTKELFTYLTQNRIDLSDLEIHSLLYDKMNDFLKKFANADKKVLRQFTRIFSSQIIFNFIYFIDSLVTIKDGNNIILFSYDECKRNNENEFSESWIDKNEFVDKYSIDNHIKKYIQDTYDYSESMNYLINMISIIYNENNDMKSIYNHYCENIYKNLYKNDLPNNDLESFINEIKYNMLEVNKHLFSINDDISYLQKYIDNKDYEKIILITNVYIQNLLLKNNTDTIYSVSYKINKGYEKFSNLYNNINNFVNIDKTINDTKEYLKYNERVLNVSYYYTFIMNIICTVYEFHYNEIHNDDFSTTFSNIMNTMYDILDKFELKYPDIVNIRNKLINAHHILSYRFDKDITDDIDVYSVYDDCKHLTNRIMEIYNSKEDINNYILSAGEENNIDDNIEMFNRYIKSEYIELKKYIKERICVKLLIEYTLRYITKLIVILCVTYEIIYDIIYCFEYVPSLSKHYTFDNIINTLKSCEQNINILSVENLRRIVFMLIMTNVLKIYRYRYIYHILYDETEKYTDEIDKDYYVTQFNEAKFNIYKYIYEYRTKNNFSFITKQMIKDIYTAMNNIDYNFIKLSNKATINKKLNTVFRKKYTKKYVCNYILYTKYLNEKIKKFTRKYKLTSFYAMSILYTYQDNEIKTITHAILTGYTYIKNYLLYVCSTDYSYIGKYFYKERNDDKHLLNTHLYLTEFKNKIAKYLLNKSYISEKSKYYIVIVLSTLFFIKCDETMYDEFKMYINNSINNIELKNIIFDYVSDDVFKDILKLRPVVKNLNELVTFDKDLSDTVFVTYDPNNFHIINKKYMAPLHVTNEDEKDYTTQFKGGNKNNILLYILLFCVAFIIVISIIVIYYRTHKNVNSNNNS